MREARTLTAPPPATWWDLAAGQHPEALAADVVLGDRGEHLAGHRAPEPDGGDLVGAVGQRGQPVLGQLRRERVPVGHAVRATGDHAEVVVAEPHDGEVGQEAALGVEHRGVDDLADRDVALRDAGALHGLQRARALDVEDLERRQVDHAGVLAHGEVLGVDDRAPPARVPLVLARHDRVAVLLDETGVGLVPERALPAGGLEEDGAELLLGARTSARCAGDGPTRTARRGARCRRS